MARFLKFVPFLKCAQRKIFSKFEENCERKTTFFSRIPSGVPPLTAREKKFLEIKVSHVRY